jgi:predicted ester cyclase
MVMHFAGTTQQGGDTYLGVVATNTKAFPNLKRTVKDMRAEGDTVAIRYSMTGTHEGPCAGAEATGKVIRSESTAFYRLSRGTIVEERAQLDLLGILQRRRRRLHGHPAPPRLHRRAVDHAHRPGPTPSGPPGPPLSTARPAAGTGTTHNPRTHRVPDHGA